MREQERRDVGLGWQNNISADSAAASRTALTSSEKLEERDQVKVSETEEERNIHPRMTERAGKYWRSDRKRDVELLKEEEQVAVLDNVDKAQTPRLSSKTHRHTAQLVRNPTPTSLCLDDPMKDNRTAGKRRGAMRSTEQHNVP